MTILCTATTKTGRPCKGEASRWPRGVAGDPQLCGRHLPVDLREIRDAGFTKEERRRNERLGAREPACWSWAPVTPKDAEDRTLTATLHAWHAGHCAVCGLPGGRLVKDHDHDTGLVRGFLCRSCNGQEPHDDGLFRKYRERPPAKILGVELRYFDPFNGWAQPNRRRRQLDDHPAYVLAPALAARLQPEGEADE